MTRYGWIWYDSDEIYNFSQADMDAKVKRYADVGITILIGFSCTHFRWSFYRHWDKINACIGKLVRACHKYGIKYVEHHSSHLTFNPQNDEDRMWAEKVLLSRNSKPEDWSGFWDDAYGDPVIDGVPLSSMRQVSGRSGKLGITTYHGYGFCFNNPDYRRLYFKYLEDVYAQGVDGIMTDDVQYFGNDGTGWASFNACTCEHCRRLLKEKTGYDIPQPEGWKDFYWNFKDPAFVAWKRMKDESTLDFAYAVKKHYEDLGYKMLRPNYISSVISTNVTALPFEKCAEIWDCIFQENCSTHIISQSWPSFAAEAVHRFCMGRKRGVPAMSMFYPCSDSALYFGWAFSMAWGQLFTQSGGENLDDYLDEGKLRHFEENHLELFEHPKKLADLTFLMSQNTRDYADGCDGYMRKFLQWMQASMMSGIATDMVFEDNGEEFGQHKVIAAVFAAMLSDKALSDLETYVKNGGKLLIVGDFGIYQTDGSRRETPALCKTQKLGKGEVILINPSECADVYQDILSVPRADHFTHRGNVQPYALDQLRETGGKALRKQLDETVYEVESESELFVSLFENQHCRTLHIVNIGDTVKKNGDCGHKDPIPAFESGAPKIGEVKVKINVLRSAESVMLYTPENKSPLSLSFSESERLEFTIPAGSFAGYCAIKIV
ncbi:MAG TPA: hypothetical protein PK629_02125 [Oscillospiraceae bacterium]|nr:hypothetical protein [Oscillospiraceae bacterium]HPF55790.1 hypothetical protein [Clostridiales bacterium]HPK35346.1 hypothetical protein [Oscillospiraceae bacterium]HPR74638.1 hypothetical protein [Oscillospiraceae bacterium]